MLGGVALALVWLLDLGTIQPNRIVPGTGHGLLSAVGWTGAGLVTGILLATIVLSTLPLRRRYELLLGLIGLSLATMPRSEEHTSELQSQVPSRMPSSA